MTAALCWLVGIGVCAALIELAMEAFLDPVLRRSPGAVVIALGLTAAFFALAALAFNL